MKKKSILILFILGIAIFSTWLIRFTQNRKFNDPSYPVKKITTLKDSGGRVDWSAQGDLIAFDKADAEGFYDVYTMKPDGTNEVCLTCRTLPRKRHRGNPAWHPSGDWIVFMSEKAEHEGSSYSSLPGYGVYTDLWIISRDGSRVYPLTKVPNNKSSGTLHPHFSSDGTKLSWSELYESAEVFVKGKEVGWWKLKVAEFSFAEGKPALSNIQTIQPGEAAFYENHGFSPDGSRLIFTSNFKEGKSVFTYNNIYTYSLEDKKVTQLTFEGYNEHASFSPDGTKIVWMTDYHNGSNGTSWWIMNSDGSDKKRLTTLKGWAADVSWSPDGTYIVGYIQNSLLKQTGKIVKIKL